MSPCPPLLATKFPHRHRLRYPQRPQPPHLQRPLSPGLPVDFATEVFCPGPSAPAVDLSPLRRRHARHRRQYYCHRRGRAKPRELPLHYTQAGERREVAVRIRRNTTGGLGSTWAIDKVEPSTK
ncbi:MAG: hypothetical protein ACLTXI_04680 [Collinsella sp.]